MKTCGRTRQLLRLILLVVDAVAAFPICVLHSACSQFHQSHRRAFFSNSPGVARSGASSTSKEFFPVNSRASNNTEFNQAVVHNYHDNSNGPVSDEPDKDAALSGTPERTFEFLKDEIGLSERAMRKMTSTKIGQKVLNFKAANLRPKIDLLRTSMNLTDDDIRTIIRRNPRVLALSADGNIVPTLEFFTKALDLDQSELRKFIMRAPQIFTLNAVNLQAKIDFFVDCLGLSLPEVRKMLLKTSTPLAFSFEKLQDTIGYLRHEVGLTDEQLKRVICMKPQLFGNQVSSLNGTVEFLRREFCFPDEQQLRRVIVTMPSLLTYSVGKNLQPKVEYLRKGFDGDDDAFRDAFLGLPALLGYSLENRIRPRLEAIIEAGCRDRPSALLVLGITKKDVDFDEWLQSRIDREKKKNADPLW